MTDSLRLPIAAILAIGLGGAAIAAEPMAAVSGNGIAVSKTSGLSNVTLTISGPDGFYVRKFAKSGSPSVALGGLSALPDGTYAYEVTGATNETVVVTDTLDNGRGPNARSTMLKGTSSSGYFTVSGGAIVSDKDAVE
jgi:hypothetical protein